MKKVLPAARVNNPCATLCTSMQRLVYIRQRSITVHVWSSCVWSKTNMLGNVVNGHLVGTLLVPGSDSLADQYDFYIQTYYTLS
jgi:hypothetical protein